MSQEEGRKEEGTHTWLQQERMAPHFLDLVAVLQVSSVSGGCLDGVWRVSGWC